MKNLDVLIFMTALICYSNDGVITGSIAMLVFFVSNSKEGK